jgi:hypothetical protein
LKDSLKLRHKEKVAMKAEGGTMQQIYIENKSDNFSIVQSKEVF